MQQLFTPSAVSDLQALVSGNAMASQYEHYINERLRQGDTFYTKLLTAEGKEAAEAALTQWNLRDRRSDFAATVAPVVQSLFAMHKAEVGLVKVVDLRENSFYPRCHGIVNPNKMFVYFNQLSPNQQATLPGATDWAPNGRLGLKAVTLKAGLDRDFRVAAELGLVLALRGEDYQQRKDGFVVVNIALNGTTRATSIEPKLINNGYLMYQLGLLEAEQTLSRSESGGAVNDSSVGFPGALNYLANKLPDLAQYFAALAKR